jgi:hypothetical protein
VVTQERQICGPKKETKNLILLHAFVLCVLITDKKAMPMKIRTHVLDMYFTYVFPDYFELSK